MDAPVQRAIQCFILLGGHRCWANAALQLQRERIQNIETASRRMPNDERDLKAWPSLRVRGEFAPV
jgi:hypothetical protein